MMKSKQRIAVSMLAIAPFLARASDHLEAPLVESDQAADIATFTHSSIQTTTRR